jgi:hypothetical protein
MRRRADIGTEEPLVRRLRRHAVLGEDRRVAEHVEQPGWLSNRSHRLPSTTSSVASPLIRHAERCTATPS